MRVRRLFHGTRTATMCGYGKCGVTDTSVITTLFCPLRPCYSRLPHERTRIFIFHRPSRNAALMASLAHPHNQTALAGFYDSGFNAVTGR